MAPSSLFLVTGGAGFIGSPHPRRAPGGGHRGRGLRNLSTRRPGKLAFPPGNPRPRIIPRAPAPRQDPKSEYAAVIPRFILWGQTGKPLQVHGDGTQSRDFTYIDNVVSANLLAARAEGSRASGKSYNVGCGSRTSLLEIIGKLEAML